MYKSIPRLGLAAIAALGVIAAPPPAEAQEAKRAIVKVAGDLYRFQNNFHYSVFLVTPEGVIATDPINAGAAKWLKAEIAKRFKVPVKYVIYSHDHRDHIAGGEVFADTATFVAHENAKATIIGEKRPTAVPDVTFAERMDIELGGKRVELTYVGPSHSDNSIVMRFPAERALFAVDIVTVNRLPIPDSWSRQIVVGKKFGLEDPDGKYLWDSFQSRYGKFGSGLSDNFQDSLSPSESDRYGKPQLVPPRLGQGSFRLVVMDAYQRRCAVTGEKTLHALEAAHIRPFAEGGKHEIRNGIFLRRDVHRLFDLGYVTITPSQRFEVSRRIKEEFENGRDYYALHGREVAVPRAKNKQPAAELLDWHNNERFKNGFEI